MPSPAAENVLTTVANVVGTEFLRVAEVDADHAVVELLVSPTLHQPYGIVHGGVYAAAAEAAATLGAQAFLDRRRCADDDAAFHAVPTVLGTQFLRSVRDGVVRVEATPVHRGRSQQLWQVRMTTADELGSAIRLIATAEVRLLNRASAASPTD